jgi:hypothetical protein
MNLSSSGWEGMIDSMIDGSAAESAAKSGDGGLLTDLVSSFPMMVGSKDPALHGKSESPVAQTSGPRDMPNPLNLPVEQDDYVGQAKQADKDGFLNKLMKIFSLGMG